MQQPNLLNFIKDIIYPKLQKMEKSLKITEEQAKELYPTSTNEFKKILEHTFGKKTFCKNFREAVKTYEDACDITGEIPINENELKQMGFLDCEISLRKIKTIVNASNILNNKWEADFSDPDQYKWFNWPIWRSGAFRFDVTYFTCTYAYVGSRLCCGSKEDMEYIGRQFEELYDKFLKGK